MNWQVVFTPGQHDKCFICGQIGHLAAACEGKVKRKSGEFDEKEESTTLKKPFQVWPTGFNRLLSNICIMS